MQFAIYGPPLRPDVAYHMARDRAGREQRARQQAPINTRADTGTACPSCGSAIYDATYGYCPACGFERTNNGHAVLDQRSTNIRCGMCGGAWPNCCRYGLRAQGRC
jgi:ribosomal protein S27E